MTEYSRNESLQNTSGTFSGFYISTSSVKCGMRVFGLKVSSTPHEPPLALSVISVEGLIVRMLACCSATTAGVMARVNVIGAGLRFTSFKLRWFV